jgi:flagellar basal body-associated protein FliL
MRMDKDHSQNTKSRTISIAIIAIVAALALLGAVVITIVAAAPQAEAGCERRGPGFTVALNASKGKCFDRGTL